MKIVFLLSRFPYPLEKGDKLRAFQHLKNLHESGNEVHLFAISDLEPTADSIAKVRPLCKSISIFRLNSLDVLLNLSLSFSRKLPLQVGYFYSKSIHKDIEKKIREIKPDLIYGQLIRTALYLKDLKEFPRLIDYQDAFSKGTFQRMQNSPAMYKSIYSRELKLVKDFERQSYSWFDGHIIISDQDRAALNVDAGKKVFVIPNGIDTSFFKPERGKDLFDITFVGNMNYPPNIDSALFLINEIMPLVWKEIPGARVQIGGANPSAAVKKLASAKVSVTGWVDDIRDCYKNTKVFIAPMRIGTGLQNKLLEAMAMQIPCITTPLSFEALKAEANKDILVGSTAGELAGHLVSLLSDENLHKHVALSGYEFTRKNYSMEYSKKMLADVILKTIEKGKH